jgi:hypothetical protein
LTTDTLAHFNDAKSGKFVSLVQIFICEPHFKTQKSVILTFTGETLAQAGHNWRGEIVIDEQDILNRTVAALRLCSPESVLHIIATHIAYETVSRKSKKAYYKGIDGTALHSVWD